MVGLVVGDGLFGLSLAWFFGGRRGIRTPDFNRVKVAEGVSATLSCCVPRAILERAVTGHNPTTHRSGGCGGGQSPTGGGCCEAAG